ncbi:MAG: hypothetical protein PHV68_08440 [Candidatus Gastranaerophilales bacterium]|nr:hypothetical protein [Candidatus Gastranaerophilales bacterium]
MCHECVTNNKNPPNNVGSRASPTEHQSFPIVDNYRPYGQEARLHQ